LQIGMADASVRAAPERKIFFAMALDKATVAKIATLARIKLTAEEEANLAGELSKIMSWIEQLNEVDTTGVEPMASVGHITLPMREDMVTDGGRPDDILANAPQQAHGFFLVPKVIE
jgi:aspartyl-tRNA(Asn)/glutamyl-tRNA(Gln) amidotransferase subunit C